MLCDGLEGRGTLLATAPRAAPVEIVEDAFEIFVRISSSKGFSNGAAGLSAFGVTGSSELFLEVERE
ncbi:hypothetical protein [Streptomyces sp. NPDC029041]|uniref:hypothetical protein n=1 Tax=Streptomyces sp. NPDC029041 TaxID=3155727 RepID=UPI0033C8EA19